MDRNVSYTHIHIQTDKKINLNIDNLTSCNLSFIKMANWMKIRGILYFFSKSLKKVDDLGLLCVHINHSRRRIFSFKRILQTYRWVFTSLVWRQSPCIKPLPIVNPENTSNSWVKKNIDVDHYVTSWRLGADK